MHRPRHPYLLASTINVNSGECNLWLRADIEAWGTSAGMRPLSPTLAQRWDRFVTHANLHQLHAADLGRFADFVNQAHRTGRHDYIDFRELLRPHMPHAEPGEVEELADYLSDLYAFGRMIRSR